MGGSQVTIIIHIKICASQAWRLRGGCPMKGSRVIITINIKICASQGMEAEGWLPYGGITGNNNNTY